MLQSRLPSTTNHYWSASTPLDGLITPSNGGRIGVGAKGLPRRLRNRNLAWAAGDRARKPVFFLPVDAAPMDCSCASCSRATRPRPSFAVTPQAASNSHRHPISWNRQSVRSEPQLSRRTPFAAPQRLGGTLSSSPLKGAHAEVSLPAHRLLLSSA